MNYWLTTHWPPYEDDPADKIYPGVWLPDGREAAGAELASGDIVFIYHAQSGRTLIETAANGTEHLRRCQMGREGIVAVGVALGAIRRLDDSTPEHYTDGSSTWWRWHAELRLESRSGFVARQEVAQALGYKAAYNFRGFGARHSGLKKLTQNQYDYLLSAFRRDRPTLPISEPTGRPHPEGGIESEAHLNLKLHVAANPAVVLGEDGLETFSVEYEFPTQDRADIVLADRFGRFIGVEVEVDCGPSHIAGILQAVKYRRMLEVITRRSHHDGRAMLVAYSVCPEVQTICSQYEVEVRVVQREDVTRVRNA